MAYREIYETLDQDHPERFNDLISVLSNPSTSDEQRSLAESLFNSCKETDPNTVVDKLVSLLEHSPDIDARKMSAIQLGNIFEKYESTRSRVVDKLVNLLEHSLDIDVRKMSAIQLGNIFEKSNSKSQSRVKDCLLDCVVKEENRPIIEVLGDTISKLAPDEKVANTLLERLASDDTNVQESALLIFPQLMQCVYDCKVPYMTRLHDVFMNCLGNLGSANVRIAALIAATSFIQWLKSDVDSFQDLLPRMRQCLVEVLDGGDEAMKQKALVSFIKLAETKPSFLTERLVEVLWSTVHIAEAESFEERTRDLAIEFAIRLEEVSNRGPADIVVRGMSVIFVGNLCKQCHPMSESTDSRVKGYLLACLVNEENKPIIEKLGLTISKLAPDKNFANLLLDNVATLQESALLIFPQLMQCVYDYKVPYIMPLHDVFMNCLGNVGSANVRIAALIAATCFIQWLKIDGDLFQDLFPRMMRCLVEVLNGGDEAMKQKALVSLIKLAETKPSFFTERLVEVVESMLQIAEAESLEERTRDLAIEFVIRLEEVSNRGPAHIHVRAMSAFRLGNLFKQCHPMSESTQSRVKGYLLACVVNEENKPIIEILGYSISMLAPDKNVANLLLDDVASLQESALLIFPHVVQYVMASNVPFTLRLRIVFKNRLRDVGSANVRIAALIALTSFIQCVMSLSDDGDWFQDLLMLCLDGSFNGGDEAMTQKALVLLIELAETDARFFKRQLDVVVWRMSQIAEDENLEEGTRLLAKKFVITLKKGHAPDTSMPDMLDIVGNLRQFRLQEGIASDQTRTPAIEKLLRQFEEKLPPNTWASRRSSLRLKSILARKEN